jgi:hypothetical protein
MPLNLPSQTSLFFEREVICQSSIIQHWPHRSNPIDRWHILTNVKALRSMRDAANVYYTSIPKPFVHRTGSRTKRVQLSLPM